MVHPWKRRLLACAAVALLLVGHGAALHHTHEDVADCLGGPCLEHDSHAAPTSTVSQDETCPLCEMRGQGHVETPRPAGGVLPLPTLCIAAAPPPVLAIEAPHLERLRARAPPRPA